MVYGGTTDANGLLGIIPLVTRTYSVPRNGNNSHPTVTTSQNYTVQAMSGNLSGSQSITLTGDQNVNVVVR
jgi:hypothetical protein